MSPARVLALASVVLTKFSTALEPNAVQLAAINSAPP